MKVYILLVQRNNEDGAEVVKVFATEDLLRREVYSLLSPGPSVEGKNISSPNLYQVAWKPFKNTGYFYIMEEHTVVEEND